MTRMMASNGTVYKGNHKAMISELEFQEAQVLLGRTERPKRHSHDFPFTGGLITCGHCGFAITAEEQVNRYGYHYIYYRCTKKSRTTRCHQPYIRREKLEAQIAQFLGRFRISDEMFSWALTYLNDFEKETVIRSLKLLNASMEKTGVCCS